MMWMVMGAVLLSLLVKTRQEGITIWIVNLVLEVFPLALACMMKDKIAALFTSYVVWGHVVNFTTYRTTHQSFSAPLWWHAEELGEAILFPSTDDILALTGKTHCDRQDLQCLWWMKQF